MNWIRYTIGLPILITFSLAIILMLPFFILLGSILGDMEFVKDTWDGLIELWKPV